MRRTMMVAGLVALLVLTVSGVAFARNFQCTQLNCEGTDRQDTIFERGGDGVSDNIFGKDRNDTLNANPFTNDVDQLNGGRGSDLLLADDGDGLDTLNGGRGIDRCEGDAGDEFVSCEVVFIDGVEQVVFIDGVEQVEELV